MSQAQRDALDAMLREAPLDLGGEVAEQREIFVSMMKEAPAPGDISTSADALGGVPVVSIDIPATDADLIVFYVHGGAYTIGSADTSVGLASDLARRAGARAISVDYRLAPENPYPAALLDIVAAYAALLEQHSAANIAIAGESAGGGLVLAALLSIREAGLSMPSAAVVMSPWADLTLSGESIVTRAPVDPTLTAEGLRRRVADYTAGQDPTDPLISPALGDLTAFPPLLIQSGSHEILLDDSIRLAAHAAAADVAVTLQVTPGVPHVFQGFAAMLEEGEEALNRGGDFLRTHFARTR